MTHKPILSTCYKLTPCKDNVYMTDLTSFIDKKLTSVEHVQLVKKFPASDRTWRFITKFKLMQQNQQMHMYKICFITCYQLPTRTDRFCDHQVSIARVLRIQQSAKLCKWNHSTLTHHWTLSWSWWIQSKLLHLAALWSILILSSHLGIQYCLFPSGSPTKTL